MEESDEYNYMWSHEINFESRFLEQNSLNNLAVKGMWSRCFHFHDFLVLGLCLYRLKFQVLAKLDH